MIKAIPTTYSNARFRSRLEAKWAAFFDLCGWRWEYEPLDFDGWVPDFGIVGHKGLILCEVKPIEWTTSRLENFRSVNRRDLDKVYRFLSSGNQRQALILGAYPVPLTHGRHFDGAIGYLVKIASGSEDRRHVLISHVDISEMAFGAKKPDTFLSEQQVAECWREASSIVQWNAKG